MEERLIAHLHIVNRLDLGLIKPLDALTIFPEAKLDFIVAGDDVCPQPMLLTFVPIALITSLIGPCIDAKAMLLVVFVLTAVLTPVIPNVDAHTLHIIVQPFSLVFATV